MTAVSQSPKDSPFRLPVFVTSVAGLLPGIALTALVATASFALRAIPGVATFSPMIIAILIGISFHNAIGTPAWAKQGVAFSMRRILRLAIILLGLQLTVRQVIEVGPIGIGIIIATVVATFGFTTWAGRLIGVSPGLTQLIAGGTSICGASAVVAVNTVTRASDEDAAYAVACVTIFGSLAMFGYPALLPLLGLSPHAYGLWTGASIHEIAQVVAASFQAGQDAGDFGLIAKLSRVMLLAPVVLGLGAWAAQGASGPAQARAPVPWFVLGFIALVGLNSLIALPPALKVDFNLGTTFLLSMALAAMGLETDIRKLSARGIRPFLLGAVASLFIAGFSLLLVKLTH